MPHRYRSKNYRKFQPNTMADCAFHWHLQFHCCDLIIRFLASGRSAIGMKLPTTVDWQVDSIGECVLVHRPALEVSVTILSRAEFAFLDAISNEQTLDFAVERAVDWDADFDLNAALGQFLSNAVLIDLWLHQRAGVQYSD